MNLLPSYKRKVIFVDEKFLAKLEERSEIDFQSFNLPDIDTKIITLPIESEEDIIKITSQIEPSEIRPGNIVLKPTYTNQYISADFFLEDIIYRKYNLFVQLCIALGAKKITVTDIKNVSLERATSQSSDGKIDANAPIAEITTNAEANEASMGDENYHSTMKLNALAEGGPPDIEKADEIISKFNLRNEPLFEDIYSMRQVKTNPIKKYEVSLDCTQDIKRMIDSSMHAKIKIMGKLYSGKAEFEKIRSSLEKNKSTTKLSVMVDF
ncbi:MAG: hypothetical protein H2067_17765 [Alcanivorax sp.]|nr:hypothetical protein [Alcanivorax sp.]